MFDYTEDQHLDNLGSQQEDGRVDAGINNFEDEIYWMLSPLVRDTSPIASLRSSFSSG